MWACMHKIFQYMYLLSASGLVRNITPQLKVWSILTFGGAEMALEKVKAQKEAERLEQNSIRLQFNSWATY